MRNINIVTLLICIAGGLYVYQYYPQEAKTIEPVPQSAAPKTHAQPLPPTLYECKSADGKKVYLETPCPQAAPVITAVPPQAAKTQQVIEDSGVATRRAEEALARQWDARMAQRDQDIAREQATANAQAAAASSACAAWRNEKEAAVSNLRRGGDAQWMNFWNQRFHAATDALYRNHC